MGRQSRVYSQEAEEIAARLLNQDLGNTGLTKYALNVCRQNGIELPEDNDKLAEALMDNSIVTWRKLGRRTLAELVDYALKNGLISKGN